MCREQHLGVERAGGAGAGSWGSDYVGLGPESELCSCPGIFLRWHQFCGLGLGTACGTNAYHRDMWGVYHGSFLGPSPILSPPQPCLPILHQDATPCLPAIPSARWNTPYPQGSQTSLHGDPPHSIQHHWWLVHRG